MTVFDLLLLYVIFQTFFIANPDGATGEVGKDGEPTAVNSMLFWAKMSNDQNMLKKTNEVIRRKSIDRDASEKPEPRSKRGSSKNREKRGESRRKSRERSASAKIS